MTENNKFFFEDDNVAEKKEDSDIFFNTLKSIAEVKEGERSQLEESKITADAEMKKHKSGILELEYGRYINNYAIHLTPVHPKKNLATDSDVKIALKELVLIMNEFVPPSLRVDLFLPKNEWKLKVISAVIIDGANAWNFDIENFEKLAIPRIIKRIEQIILSGKV